MGAIAPRFLFTLAIPLDAVRSASPVLTRIIGVIPWDDVYGRYGFRRHVCKVDRLSSIMDVLRHLTLNSIPFSIIFSEGGEA